jgi:hypothetical protein
MLDTTMLYKDIEALEKHLFEGKKGWGREKCKHPGNYCYNCIQHIDEGLCTEGTEEALIMRYFIDIAY